MGIGGADKAHVQHVGTLIVVDKQAVTAQQPLVFLASQALSNPAAITVAVHLDTVFDRRWQGSGCILA